jgi:hypothetical protein
MMAGADGTPVQWHAFADFLRRALHAAADQVEPRADGLELIREKIPSPAVPGRAAARRRRRRHGVRS